MMQCFKRLSERIASLTLKGEHITMKNMIKNFVFENKYLLLVVFLVSMILSNLFCVYWIVQMEKTVNQKSDNKFSQVPKMELMNLSSVSVQDYYFDEYTDLKECPKISIDDLNYILDRWNEVTGGNSNFTGMGEYFMAASLRSGYNPIYLIAHAAVESGWGTSNLAVNYGNLFGIGAYDYSSGYYVADSIEQGIINGSIWINTYFYLEGYNTLNAMQNAGYAANENWQYDIVSIVRSSYVFLKEADI